MNKPKIVKPKDVSKIAKTPAKVFSKKVSPVTIPHKALAGQSSDAVADVLDVILSDEITSMELQYVKACGTAEDVKAKVVGLLTKYREDLIKRVESILTPIENGFTTIQPSFALNIKKRYVMVPAFKYNTLKRDHDISFNCVEDSREPGNCSVDDLKSFIPELPATVKELLDIEDEKISIQTRLKNLRKKRDNAGVIVKKHKIANEYKIDDKTMGELKTMILGDDA